MFLWVKDEYYTDKFHENSERLYRVKRTIPLDSEDLYFNYQVLKENLIPAFDEIRVCMHLAEKVLLQVRIREDILEDLSYKYISSVDQVNRMVANGVTFRDAYQEVAQQIRNKTYSPDQKFEHTHEGSIGNLCLDEICNKMNERMKAFDFNKIDTACKALLEG